MGNLNRFFQFKITVNKFEAEFHVSDKPLAAGFAELEGIGSDEYACSEGCRDVGPMVKGYAVTLNSRRVSREARLKIPYLMVNLVKRLETICPCCANLTWLHQGWLATNKRCHIKQKWIAETTLQSCPLSLVSCDKKTDDSIFDFLPSSQFHKAVSHTRAPRKTSQVCDGQAANEGNQAALPAPRCRAEPGKQCEE